jgi:hypothetical protein
MYLATVTTLKERILVGAYVSATAWIGGNDIQNEGIWTWAKGVDPWLIHPCDPAQPGCDDNINMWNENQPANIKGDEDCLVLYLDTDKFSAVKCGEYHDYLCERSP